MKGEWHRYNLKRRVAQLPPISEELFESKVTSVNEKKKEEESTKEIEEGVKNIQLTAKQQRKKQREELLEKKRKLLELAKNRLVSNGGRVKLSEDGKIIVEKKESTNEEQQLKKEVEEAVSKENEENDVDEETLIKEKLANKVDVPITKCIFCKDEEFSIIDETFEHLFKKHGLYVPEKKYLVNKEGLLTYLYEKIGYGNICLSCNFQGRNFQSIIQHMLGKNHIKIPYESEDEKLEISDFYDFSKTYEISTAEDEGNEGEWEDVDDEELENDEDIDGEKLYATDYGLHLPNGVVLGHRSLVKYYKQNLKPEKEFTEAQGTVMAAETRNFVTTIDSKALAQQKRVWSKEAKHRDRDDRRAQKFINWQPHYRDELLQ
jgi:pre-60S factor REI1